MATASTRVEAGKNILWALLLLLMLVFFFVITPKTFVDSLVGSTRLTKLARANIVAMLFVFGAVAHFFKVLNRQWYGYVEILVAVAAAWRVTGTSLTDDATTNLILLLGAVYVIVQGVTNAIEGQDERIAARQEVERAGSQ